MTLRRLQPLVEWALLILAAPTLVFPGAWTAPGAAALGATWLVRRVNMGRWSVGSPGHPAALALAAATIISAAISLEPSFSAPKLWGLALGLGTFYVCLNTCGGRQGALRMAALLTAGSAALMPVALAGMAAPPEKLFADGGLFGSGPIMSVGLPSSHARVEGFHPNEIGGTLTLILPVAVALLAVRGWPRVLGAGASMILVPALVLTQSRGAMLGVACALGIGAIWAFGWRSRLMRALVALAAIAMAGGLLVLTAASLRTVGEQAASGPTTLTGRVETWRQGALMVLDMPFTGIGLNTLPLLLPTYYPTVQQSLNAFVPHAHNLYLQTLIDLGVGGLAAFLALVALAVRSGLRVAREHGPDRPVVIGFTLALLAHGIYSLADAVTLGAKPGAVLWCILGVLAAQTAGPQAISLRRWLAARLRRPRGLGWLLAALPPLLLVLSISPAAVNAARVALHRAPDRASPPPPAWTATALGIAHAAAWGPYVARAWAATALEARARDDSAGEVRALERALGAAPWDQSLALQLGDARYLQGDRDGALEAWRQAGAMGLLLDRAQRAGGEGALHWFELAAALDTSDWRPPAAAAAYLSQTPQITRASPLLAQALRLRGDDPARNAVAARLESRSAPLPDGVLVRASTQDGELFYRAATLLEQRDDLLGAAYAGELAVLANPTHVHAWTILADVRARLGQHALAEEAQRRAQAPRR